ncbi:unnamed protein product, partial [Symbiodinium sp. CCMP2456]
IAPWLAASHSAVPFEHGEGEDDYLLQGSWFAYEDAIDDWCDIAWLGNGKRGPALRNRLEGEAAIHKWLLDRDRLKDPNNGVNYFKSFLRPLFVKSAANVFVYRFQQFMKLHRGNGDMTIPITANSPHLCVVSLSDLTQDQRQVLTRASEPCAGHGGRKTFLAIDEGYLDNHEGYWVVDEEGGTEGFLEADDDTFWVYDEENYTWFPRGFQ